MWARRYNIESPGKYGFGDWRYMWGVKDRKSDYIGFHPDGGIQCGVNNGNERVMTNLKYQDPDGLRWNHIVCTVDTSQAEESERMKLFINGALQTDLDVGYGVAYPTKDYSVATGAGNDNSIGRDPAGGGGFFGRLADFHLLQGIAVGPENFGQGTPGVPNADGGWYPKQYVGEHGPRGYAMDFSDKDNLGFSSVNGNNMLTKKLSSTSAIRVADVPDTAPAPGGATIIVIAPNKKCKNTAGQGGGVNKFGHCEAGNGGTFDDCLACVTANAKCASGVVNWQPGAGEHYCKCVNVGDPCTAQDADNNYNVYSVT